MGHGLILVEAGQLSPSLVERYLQLKERALL
jgi:hypothetical protein